MKTLAQWNDEAIASQERIAELIRQTKTAAGELRKLEFSSNRAARARARDRVNELMAQLTRATEQHEQLFKEDVLISADGACACGAGTLKVARCGVARHVAPSQRRL